MQHLLVLLCALSVEPSDCTGATAMKQLQTPRMSQTQCEETGEKVTDAIQPPSGAYYRVQCRPDDSPDPA
jgi:hypothetical protein